MKIRPQFSLSRGSKNEIFWSATKGGCQTNKSISAENFQLRGVGEGGCQTTIFPPPTIVGGVGCI